MLNLWDCGGYVTQMCIYVCSIPTIASEGRDITMDTGYVGSLSGNLNINYIVKWVGWEEGGISTHSPDLMPLLSYTVHHLVHVYMLPNS